MTTPATGLCASWPGRLVPIIAATAAAFIVYVVNSMFITASQLLGGAIALATR